jgi:hypothetical protein
MMIINTTTITPLIMDDLCYRWPCPQQQQQQYQLNTTARTNTIASGNTNLRPNLKTAFIADALFFTFFLFHILQMDYLLMNLEYI